MKKLLIAILLVSVSAEISAQSFYNRRIERQWVASFGTGTAKYFGDLAAPGDIFQGTLYNLEAGLEKRFQERFSARANLTFFQLSGSDAIAGGETRYPRNLSFKSINFELSAVGIAQLYPEIGRYYQRKPLNPYFFLGVAALYYNPRTDVPATYHDGTPIPNAGKMVSLRKYNTELANYSPVTICFPVGVGMKIKVHPMFNLSVNGGYRFTLSDYLDDVSTKHPGDAAFSDPLAAALSDRRPEIGVPQVEAGHRRGNPNKKDGYFIVSVRVEYYLPPNFFSKRGPKKYGGGSYKRSKRR